MQRDDGAVHHGVEWSVRGCDRGRDTPGLRGRGGGLKLARPPNKIGLGQVVREVEEDFTMVECFDPKINKCAITGPCRLRGALSRALKAYLAVLDEYTLADLAVDHPMLSRILVKAS